MRSLRYVVLAIGATVIFGGPAYGQFFMSKIGKGAGPSQLLLREEVQQELKITPDQLKQIKAINDKIREGLEEEFAAMSTLTGKERDRKKLEMGTRIKQRARESVKGILTPEQHQRLDEIALQAVGVLGLKDEEVKEKLRLTADQNAKILETMQDGIKEMQALFKHSDEEFEKNQALAGEIREKVYEKALTVLTPDQRKTWDKLQGKPFDFRAAAARKPSPILLKGEIPLPPTAMPAPNKAELDWVAVRAETWQPKPEEKRFNQIGWAETDLRGGLKTAKEHQLPLFVFLVDGYSHRGRC